MRKLPLLFTVFFLSLSISATALAMPSEEERAKARRALNDNLSTTKVCAFHAASLMAGENSFQNVDLYVLDGQTVISGYNNLLRTTIGFGIGDFNAGEVVFRTDHINQEGKIKKVLVHKLRVRNFADLGELKRKLTELSDEAKLKPEKTRLVMELVKGMGGFVICVEERQKLQKRLEASKKQHAS